MFEPSCDGFEERYRPSAPASPTLPPMALTYPATHTLSSSPMMPPLPSLPSAAATPSEPLPSPPPPYLPKPPPLAPPALLPAHPRPWLPAPPTAPPTSWAMATSVPFSSSRVGVAVMLVLASVSGMIAVPLIWNRCRALHTAEPPRKPLRVQEESLAQISELHLEAAQVKCKRTKPHAACKPNFTKSLQCARTRTAKGPRHQSLSKAVAASSSAAAEPDEELRADACPGESDNGYYY